MYHEWTRERTVVLLQKILGMGYVLVCVLIIMQNTIIVLRICIIRASSNLLRSCFVFRASFLYERVSHGTVLVCLQNMFFMASKSIRCP